MGRKKLGNELFARRLSKAQIAAVEALLAGEGVSVAPEPQKAVEAKETPTRGVRRDDELARLNAHNYALAEAEDRLVKEIEGLKLDLEEARSTNLDANGAYWKGMYVQLKTQVMKNNDLSQ